MVRIASILVLGACAVFSAASAMPEAGYGMVDFAAELEKRAKTITRTSTKKNGHTVVKTTTRSRNHKSKTTKTTSTTSKSTKTKTTSTTSTSTTSTTPVVQPTSCADIAALGSSYTDPQGTTYDIECGQNIKYSDVNSTPADNYADCFAICDAYNGCLGFTYYGGNCNLKNAVVVADPPSGDNNPYDSASLPNAPDSPSGSCAMFDHENDYYVDANGAEFDIYCGQTLTDFYVTHPADTYGDCFFLCDVDASCTGITFDSGTCSFTENMSLQSGSGDSAIYLGQANY